MSRLLFKRTPPRRSLATQARTDRAKEARQPAIVHCGFEIPVEDDDGLDTTKIPEEECLLYAKDLKLTFRSPDESTDFETRVKNKSTDFGRHVQIESNDLDKVIVYKNVEADLNLWIIHKPMYKVEYTYHFKLFLISMVHKTNLTHLMERHEMVGPTRDYLYTGYAVMEFKRFQFTGAGNCSLVVFCYQYDGTFHKDVGRWYIHLNVEEM